MAPLIRAQTTSSESPDQARAIRLIVPSSPGQSYDFIARQTAARLSQALQQPVTVINMLGAGGSVAISAMLASPANGETLAMGTFGSVVIAPLLNPKLGYTPEALTPVAALSSDASVLLVSNTGPISSLADLKKKAASAQSIRIGHIGIGSTGHLLTIKLQNAWEVRLIDVPYKNIANAMRDLVAGDIDAVVLSSGTAATHIKNQIAKGLAISDTHRNPCIPQVRTFKEQNMDIELTSWFALLVPRAAPANVTEKLTRELRKIQLSSDLKEVFNTVCITPSRLSTKEFAASLQQEVEHWRTEIRRSDLDRVAE
jgi:hypothetical protein